MEFSKGAMCVVNDSREREKKRLHASAEPNTQKKRINDNSYNMCLKCTIFFMFEIRCVFILSFIRNAEL